MIVLSVGMPRAGSGWHYNLIHDLMEAAGYIDARVIREKYRLQNILTEVNCNIGVLSVRRMGMVAVPALMGKDFVIKAHAGPSASSRLLQSLGLLRITYIYRDPRDAMLSAFDYGQRALQKGRPNAFSHLTDLPPLSTVKQLALRSDNTQNSSDAEEFIIKLEQIIKPSFNDKIFLADSVVLAERVIYFQKSEALEIEKEKLIDNEGHIIIKEKYFLLGTDEFGRDLFSRLIYGTRISLTIGICAVVLSFIIGIILGFIAGYRGGLLDIFLNRFTEIFLAFPVIYLVVLILVLFGISIISVIIVLGARSRSRPATRRRTAARDSNDSRRHAPNARSARSRAAPMAAGWLPDNPGASRLSSDRSIEASKTSEWVGTRRPAKAGYPPGTPEITSD